VNTNTIAGSEVVLVLRPSSTVSVIPPSDKEYSLVDIEADFPCEVASDKLVVITNFVPLEFHVALLMVLSDHPPLNPIRRVISSGAATPFPPIIMVFVVVKSR
jgi:hypothetical protein